MTHHLIAHILAGLLMLTALMVFVGATDMAYHPAFFVGAGAVMFQDIAAKALMYAHRRIIGERVAIHFQTHENELFIVSALNAAGADVEATESGTIKAVTGSLKVAHNDKAGMVRYSWRKAK